MTRHLSAALLLAAALGLSACGSVPPAPTDNFYRLQASQLPTAKELPAGLNVRNVRADSLYAERPIVFVNASDPRQLRQYHYNLWLYPPAQMVREHMQQSFGTAGSKPLIADIRIVSFERMLDGKTSSANVALEVTLLTEEKPQLEKRYQAAQAATDDSFSAFAVAMEKSLASIYGEILRDASALRVDRR